MYKLNLEQQLMGLKHTYKCAFLNRRCEIMKGFMNLWVYYAMIFFSPETLNAKYVFCF